MLTILFGLGYFLFQNRLNLSNYGWLTVALPIFFALCLFIFILAIAVGVFYYRPVDFNFADPMVLVDTLKGVPYAITLSRIAATIAKQVSKNREVVNKRGAHLEWVMTLTAIGFFLMFLTGSLLVYLWMLS
ncbi:MAG: hypothetical protein ABSF82_02725 [Candidatus Bathyarchaeia archaeon]